MPIIITFHDLDSSAFHELFVHGTNWHPLVVLMPGFRATGKFGPSSLTMSPYA